MKVLLKNKTLPHETNIISLKWSVWNDIIHIINDKIVLFNTLYRNAVLIDNTLLDNLDLLNDSQIEQLFNLGMLVSESKDEKTLWEKDFIKAKDDYSYIDLTLLVTNSCQMKCIYCFEGEKKKVFLEDDVEISIISYLETKKEYCRKLRMTWFGGEPLLAYHIIERLSDKIMNFCKKNNIEYTGDITTNGYSLNEERIDKLVNIHNVKRFIITIDGPQNIHDSRRPLINNSGSFKNIWLNINKLIDARAWVTIRITIDRQNVEYIPEFIDFLAQSGLSGRVGLSFCRTVDINFTPDDISPNLFTESEFKDIEWRLMQYAHDLGLYKYDFPYSAPLGGCLRNGDIVIDPTGKIYKCLDTVGDERWIIGDITTNSNNISRPDWFRNWQYWTPLKNNICKNCVLVPLCNGGCPHNALFKDKRHGTTTSCPDWKNNYQRQIKQIVIDNYAEEII